jgi:hypothetical protein
MSDFETKYTVDFRVRKLPLNVVELSDYVKAWYDLSDKQYRYFSLNTRENMRAFNNAYSHWHTLAEDLERKYANQKGFGET